MTILPDYYTIREAAEVIGRSQSQVSRYITRGLLEAKSFGPIKLIRQADVHSFTPPPRGNPLFRRRKS